jgi:mitochondrial fission protein ELM1
VPPFPSPAPRTWLILGDKRGDNGQVEVIAETLASQLGWPSERRNIVMRPRYVQGKPRVGPTLYHIDKAQSDELAPPWPDIILTCGRRPANVALWIRQQSGGRTRIVLVGKPSGYMSHFDLIITSAETLVPPFPNVLNIGLPLMRIDSRRLAEGRSQWQTRLEALPRPLTAFLIGGPTNPFIYDESIADRLLELARQVAEAGGTPYFVTSRRTPPKLIKQLGAELPPRARLYDWSDPQAENPYTGLLALGDRYIVTGDSISMMVEVAQLNKPLEILPLPTGWVGGLDLQRRNLAASLFQPARNDSITEQGRVQLARLLFHVRLLQQTRHFSRFHALLVKRGIASRAGEAVVEARIQAEEDSPVRKQTEKDLSLITDHILDLWATHPDYAGSQELHPDQD